MNNWYTNSKPDAAQGLICDEVTGKNIAVSYDPEHAHLIAAAPRLFEAAREAAEFLYGRGIVPKDPSDDTEAHRVGRLLREVLDSLPEHT